MEAMVTVRRVVATGFVALFLVSCGKSNHTLTLTMAEWWTRNAATGSPCYAYVGLMVKDGDGTIIGSANNGTGKVIDTTDIYGKSVCQQISVAIHVPDEPVYTIEAKGYPPRTVSKEELESLNWQQGFLITNREDAP